MMTSSKKIEQFISFEIFIVMTIAFLAVLFPLYCAHFNVMIGGPNEGWNAYFADAAMGKMPLYPDAHQLITNNYPPLSFYIVGFVGKLMGDNILAGRFLSLIALLFIAFFIFKTLQLLGGERRAALVGAAYFLATMGIFFSVYVGMNDPQLLALAIMMGGFYLFLTAVQQGSSYWLPMFYRAGKPFIVDGFDLQERIRTNKMPANVVTELIKKHLLTKIDCNSESVWPCPDANFLKLKSQFQQFEDASDGIKEERIPSNQ